MSFNQKDYGKQGQNSLLEKRVKTRNLVNAKATEVRGEICRLLEKHDGRKIIKVTPYRSFVKPVGESLGALQRILQDQGFRLIFDLTSTYRVYAALDTTFPCGEHSVDYVKKLFCVCGLEDDVLANLVIEHEEFRSDYTVEEIIELRKRREELDQQLRDVKHRLEEFYQE